MVQMLSIYQQEKGEDDFTNLIMELANEVGMRFPDYLKSPVENGGIWFEKSVDRTFDSLCFGWHFWNGRGCDVGHSV